MGKTRSEIQKAYRERQKAKGRIFLAKERIRQTHYFKPIAELSERKRCERNVKNKLRNRLCRLRKKQHEEGAAAQQIGETSGYESATDQTNLESSVDDEPTSPQRLIVRLPIQGRSNSKKAIGLRKTKARAQALANKKIVELKRQNNILKKKIKIKNRHLTRMSSKKSNVCKSNEVTPRKQTEAELKQLNLTPKRHQLIRKKLILSNTVMLDIGKARRSTSAKKRQVIHRIVSGEIAKKYRCLNYIRRTTGLGRRSLSKVCNKNLVAVGTEQRYCLAKKMETPIVEFLNRDDNSRAQPGKADAKKMTTGVKKQTRVLTDYMKNLYEKFKSEIPEADVSLTTFQRLRPKNILLTSFISRNTCQCIYHQNMALKVQAIRSTGVKIGPNPERLLTHLDELDTLLEQLPEQVSFKSWKKVEVAPGKMRMKVIEKEIDAATFKTDVKQQLATFAEHVSRVREQYTQVKTLKENLRSDEAILQMDFAENFSCRSLNEVQTAYWNQSMVTLHPVVAYYKDGDELKHQSFVVVSDEMSHSSSTVCAFIDQLIPSLKLIKPTLSTVHYWTDSPSSQYRNRYIFHLIANHQRIYDVAARWNYFEVGHGKGPCDGLGGTVKRMADEAIKQGRSVIQDATEFYTWADKSSMKGVKFIYVPKVDTESKRVEMSSITAKPLKGTMKLHAVGITNSVNKLMTRDTSCYCVTCLGGQYCNSWIEQVFSSTATAAVQSSNERVVEPMSVDDTIHHDIVLPNDTADTNTSDATPPEETADTNTSDATPPEETADTNTSDATPPEETADTNTSDATPPEETADTNTSDATPPEETADTNTTATPVTVDIGNYVAAVYENKWYIGQVISTDIGDDEIEVNFMKHAQQLFNWPQHKDCIWVDGADILCTVHTLSASGKSARYFKLDRDEEKKISSLFQMRNTNN